MLMKKSNKVLVGCLALLLVMAVGYALFSETITINGTATAKGEFKMQVECIKGLKQEFKQYIMDNFYEDVTESGYKNDTCSVSGNEMSYSVEFEYPGARRFFTAKITNKGTMDAILNLDEGITNFAEIYIDNNKNGTFEESERTTDNQSGLLQEVYGFEKADGTLITVDNSDDFVYEEDETYFIKLKPGESMYVFFPGAVSELFDGNYIYFQYTGYAKFNFTQANH